MLLHSLVKVKNQKKCWQHPQQIVDMFLTTFLIIIMIMVMIFVNSAALSKIRRAAGTCHSVLTKRCAFRRRAKVAVDSVDRRSSAGKLFHVSGPETSKFLRVAATNGCGCGTTSLPVAADRRCRRPVRWTTGRQSSARYGGAKPGRHLLTWFNV